MRIFEFNWNNGGVKDWIISPSKQEAIQHYKDYTNNNSIDDTVVTEVPKEKWPTIKTIDPNEYHEDEEDSEDFDNGYRIVESFQDIAKKHKSGSRMICSTEY